MSNSEQQRFLWQRLGLWEKYCTLCSQQTTQLEYEEYIRIKPESQTGAEVDVNSRYQDSSIYILLRIERNIEVLLSDEIRITIIPLASERDGSVSKIFSYGNRKVWSAKADLIKGEVQFANFMNFQIEPEDLRGRGLGSYVLSKLVEWVKEFNSNFSVQLWIHSLDESPENAHRVDGLYEKFNFPNAKAIADIVVPPASEKVEKIALEEILPKLLVENSDLRKSTNNMFENVVRLGKYWRNQKYKAAVGMLVTGLAAGYFLK